MEAMRLSDAVGRRLGLTATQASAAGVIAALQDFGRSNLPAAVLNKPGPLTSAEGALLRRRPLVGDDVPLIDRVAYTCAAYEAMLSDRPYRRALSKAAARTELLAGAGTQFCERTVRALLDALAA